MFESEFKDICIERFPRTLRELVELIGIEQAFILTEKYGGRSKYIAKNHLRSGLRGILSDQALKILCSEFAGLTIEIPVHSHFMRQQRNLRIVSEAASGVSRSDLAQKYQLCLRQIGNIRSNAAFME